MKEESSSGNQSVDALISVGPTLTPASNGVNAGLLQIPDGDFEAFCLEKERKITGLCNQLILIGPGRNW
jgi:hypothetical protein